MTVSPPSEELPSGGSAAASDASRVPAVERAFAALAFLRDHGPATLTEIVADTEINKSTALYILRALLDLQAVSIDEARRYSLGPALIGLGHAASGQNDVLTIAKRYLVELLERMDVTIVLYRRVDATHIGLVDKLERVHRVRITVSSGSRLPIQGGSFGRCFLAFDPPELVDEVLAGGLQQFTPKSTSDVGRFRTELAEVRNRRWAVDHEGFALGVSTVAAPIFDEHGRLSLVAAAVGFTNLMTDDVCVRYGELLRDTCDTVTRTVGGLVPGFDDVVASERTAGGTDAPASGSEGRS